MKKKNEMSLHSQLEKVLKEDRLETAPDTSNNLITLKEKQASMKVGVTRVPALTATIMMSKISHLPALKDGPWKKICDYLLIAQIGETHHAIFIELKKTLIELKKTPDGDDRPKEQLRRSRPLLEYLLALCSVESRGAIPPPNMSYVLIGERINEKFDKQPVKRTASGKIGEESYEEINIKKFLGPTVAFADLIRDS